MVAQLPNGKVRRTGSKPRCHDVSVQGLVSISLIHTDGVRLCAGELLLSAKKDYTQTVFVLLEQVA